MTRRRPGLPAARIFGGRRYVRLLELYPTRAAADMMASRIRRKGFAAHVVKGYLSASSRYPAFGVYWRPRGRP